MIGHLSRRRATRTLSLLVALAIATPALHAVDGFGTPEVRPVPAEGPPLDSPEAAPRER